DAEGAGPQLLDGFFACLAGADQAHDFVDIAHGEDQAFEDVPALLRLFQQEPRAADDHFLAVLDEVLNQLFQAHRPRLTVHQCDVDHRYRDLARRELVELVDDDVRVGVALQVDHHAHLVLAAAVVVGVGDAGDVAALRGFGDRLQHGHARHAVGQLADHHDRAAAFLLFGFDLGAQRHFAAAGGVAFDDAAAPAD